MAAQETLAAALSSGSWTLNPFFYSRRKTRVVMVGSVAVGGDHPLRVQSMTTTDTMDTQATVDQIRRLADAGCEIARITAPTVLDAQNLESIKSRLLQANLHIPLVADIHFRPDAAMVAADFVEKVRVNPGNFVDGKAFKVREYTDDEYQSELHRIEDKFTPLVLKLKKLKRAVRIGTNHGSLSDRIMNRFGDTPLGMVESALEYVRICEKNDYRDIILSMKASNPRVMVAAYRLLAHRMEQEKMDYPFHLGVTEAGDGEDGRIKSAAGIGSLLEDGIGDTIRVSLTEDPEYEVPVAFEIARRYHALWRTSSAKASQGNEKRTYVDDPIAPARRETSLIQSGPIEFGDKQPIRVISTVALEKGAADRVMEVLEDRVKKDAPPEIIWIDYKPGFESEYEAFRENLQFQTQRLSFWVAFQSGRIPDSINFKADGFVLIAGNKILPDDAERLKEITKNQKSVMAVLAPSAAAVLSWVRIQKNLNQERIVVGIDMDTASSTVHEIRALVAGLRECSLAFPVLLRSSHPSPALHGAIVFGGLICDGIGDLVQISSAPLTRSNVDFTYNLLQACGNRSTKTEYVSCPSCGRTLFDLQSTTERIKSKTGHLKGVKIAIMGCIVNGPGEMADADFGYVGGGPGKINLYVGKSCVEKSIPSEVADEKLIQLIKSHGKWVEPPK